MGYPLQPSASDKSPPSSNPSPSHLMCGLAGVFLAQPDSRLESNVRQMSDSLYHRGPDEGGVWVDAHADFAIGHRRLSIVELSAAGRQPMLSADGRYVLAFNGEIYNHHDLRSELARENQPIRWRGQSDTETLVASFTAWGVERTLQRCVGMFAIAWWDKINRTLTLARDRMGEKPLYYGWTRTAFVFGSELKALKAYPDFASPVCRQALTQFLRFLYVPAPRSIYQSVYKLEPGCLVTVTRTPPTTAPTRPLRPGETHGTLAVHRWWHLATAVAGRGPCADDTEAGPLSRLENALQESIRLQSLADVPVGAFLSGGVDSSTIVALMQRQSPRPVQTFTIAFEEAEYDESPYALAVARHLGTDHHEMRVTAPMAQAVIPRLPAIYDEPFADASQIPTHLVCRAARQHVTVALSGDAGDELFGGYNRHFWGPRLWSRLGSWPYPVRQTLSRLLTALPAQGWDRLARPLGVVRPGEKLQKLGRALNRTRDINHLYRNLVSEWPDPASLVLDGAGGGASEPASLLDDPLPSSGTEHAALRMMYLDTISYLPDDILCKVDRAAMACSLETRVPFLDHRVVELAWKLPLDLKVRGPVGKWALRELLYKYVPRRLIDRPKAGFAVPLGPWLRGPLRDWAESLLSEPRLLQQGYLRPAPIRKLWSEHLRGNKDHTASLWAVLMFQAWLEETRPPSS